MSILDALVLGLIRGAAGVLPVSSSGISALAGRLMGVDVNADPLFVTWLGIGVLAAVAVVWHREIAKLLTALGAMAIDITANLLILLLGKNTKYRSIICTAYRKTALMLLISLVPSVIINCLFGEYAASLYGSLLPSCIGMLLTAMLLMVASFAGRQKAGPKEAGLFHAVITGAFYGFSVFPGVSRIGTAAAGGFISEFTARFTAAYAFLLYFITGIVSAAAGFAANTGSAVHAGIPAYIAGTAVSAVSAYYVMKRLRKRFRASGSIGFAVFGAVIGIVLLIAYFI